PVHLKVAFWMQWIMEKFSPRAHYLRRRRFQKGELMTEQSVRLGPREQQIVELLLQGCDNAEIASQLKIARRTVKAHFNRLFLRFGISGGIKRVKLATLLYRRQLCSEASATENAFPASESSVSSNSSLRDSKTGKSQMKSAPQSTSSK